ncbi:retropepsin-like aspartic protease [Prosthecobacter fusiformis]|nr:retropepsin-like aspartic protease [Prosthecobacter fusiformis]
MTLPLRLSMGVPVLEAGINGRGAVSMMLDTGASRTMLQAATAVSHKVPIMRAEDAKVEMQGVVGKETGRIGLLNPLTLGSWSLNGYPCLVRTYENRLTGMSGAASFPESLLGFDVAVNYCRYLTLNYPGESVIFGFGQAFVPQAGTRKSSVPFKMKHGVPFITLRSGAHSWEAIVDSGSFNGIEINEEVAKKLGVHQGGRKVSGLYLMSIGGTVSSSQANLRTVKLPDLTLCGGKYKEVEVDISPGPPRVGSHFLKDYRATFDFKSKKLWLEW